MVGEFGNHGLYDDRCIRAGIPFDPADDGRVCGKAQTLADNRSEFASQLYHAGNGTFIFAGIIDHPSDEIITS